MSDDDCICSNILCDCMKNAVKDKAAKGNMGKKKEPLKTCSKCSAWFYGEAALKRHMEDDHGN